MRAVVQIRRRRHLYAGIAEVVLKEPWSIARGLVLARVRVRMLNAVGADLAGAKALVDCRRDEKLHYGAAVGERANAVDW